MLCRHANLRRDGSLGETDAAVVLPEQALEPVERHRGNRSRASSAESQRWCRPRPQAASVSPHASAHPRA